MKNPFSNLNWKYVLFITVFLIICLEIFGRVFLTVILKKSTKPKFQFDSYRIYSHIPGFREGDGKKNWIVINGQGFRRNVEVPKSKPEGTFRVFLMGGSAAHGISTAAPYPLVHIYMDQTIDFYLEKKLKMLHPGKKIEVINAAVTGYQVFQHTAYILSDLLNYNPDAIIFIDGINDHYFNNPEYEYYHSNHYQFWKPRLQHPSLSGILDYFILWMTKFSGFARGYYALKLKYDAHAYDRLPVTSNKDYKTTEELIQAQTKTARKNFLRSIETNILILQANDIKTIVCHQPILVLRNEQFLSKAEKSFLFPNFNIKTLYPAVQAGLSELTTRYKVPFIDLNKEFNKQVYSQKQLLVDYCHLSPLGGEVIAQALVPVLDSVYTECFKK